MKILLDGTSYKDQVLGSTRIYNSVEVTNVPECSSCKQECCREYEKGLCREKLLPKNCVLRFVLWKFCDSVLKATFTTVLLDGLQLKSLRTDIKVSVTSCSGLNTVRFLNVQLFFKGASESVPP